MNRTTKTTILLGIALTMLFSMVHASTITGVVYDGLTIEPLGNTILTINTIPAQTKVSKQGIYSFEIPNGTYTLKATYSEKGIILMKAEQEIQIEEEGVFNVDIILLPEIDDLPDDPLPDDEPIPAIWDQLLRGPIAIWGLILVILTTVTYVAISVQKGTTANKKEKTANTELEEKEKTNEKNESKKEEQPLDKYAIETIEILQRGGNRLTQKELREKVTIGEAKVSLILTELEEYEEKISEEKMKNKIEETNQEIMNTEKEENKTIKEKQMDREKQPEEKEENKIIKKNQTNEEKQLEREEIQLEETETNLPYD